MLISVFNTLHSEATVSLHMHYVKYSVAYVFCVIVTNTLSVKESDFVGGNFRMMRTERVSM